MGEQTGVRDREEWGSEDVMALLLLLVVIASALLLARRRYYCSSLAIAIAVGATTNDGVILGAHA